MNKTTWDLVGIVLNVTAIAFTFVACIYISSREWENALIAVSIMLLAKFFAGWSQAE
jgi:hypothetical protein